MKVNSAQRMSSRRARKVWVITWKLHFRSSKVFKQLAINIQMTPTCSAPSIAAVGEEKLTAKSCCTFYISAHTRFTYLRYIRECQCHNGDVDCIPCTVMYEKIRHWQWQISHHYGHGTANLFLSLRSCLRSSSSRRRYCISDNNNFFPFRFIKVKGHCRWLH